MRYEMRVVEDEQLPDASRWVFVKTNDVTWLLVTRSLFEWPEGFCARMTEAWEAWQAATAPTPLLAAI